MEPSTFQDLRKLINLKRCDSVLCKNSALFHRYNREAAQDLKPSIQALVNALEAQGATNEVVTGFLILEQYLMELEGDTSLTTTDEKPAVLDSFQARFKCSESNAPKKLTKSAAKRYEAFVSKGAA